MEISSLFILLRPSTNFILKFRALRTRRDIQLYRIEYILRRIIKLRPWVVDEKQKTCSAFVSERSGKMARNKLL